MTVLIVSGSRDGHPHVAQVLDRWVTKHGAPELVVLGDASGVDRQALDWCIDQGHFFVAFCADWERWGRAAGPHRNLAMARCPDQQSHLVAFPVGLSSGTRSCIHLCMQQEHRVFEVDLRGVPMRYWRGSLTSAS